MTQVEDIEETVNVEPTTELTEEQSETESLRTDEISDESDDDNEDPDQMDMFQNLLNGGVDTDKLDELVDAVGESNQKLDTLIELMKMLVEHLTGEEVVEADENDDNEDSDDEDPDSDEGLDSIVEGVDEDADDESPATEA